MLKRLIPLLLLLLMLLLVLFFDLQQLISFDQLKAHRTALISWVGESPLVAPLAFMLLYFLVVLFSLPGGLILTLTGGFLFGAVAGGIYTVIAATAGAVALFLVAKSSLGDFLLARAGDGIKRMQAGFNEDALSYMFFLRLVPIFPFFMVNLVPAFLGVRLRDYFIATLFGIMPATFVFALTGSGLGALLDQSGALSLHSVMTPELLGALTGLGLLALIPVAYKRIRRRGAAS